MNEHLYAGTDGLVCEVTAKIEADRLAAEQAALDAAAAHDAEPVEVKPAQIYDVGNGSRVMIYTDEIGASRAIEVSAA